MVQAVRATGSEDGEGRLTVATGRGWRVGQWRGLWVRCAGGRCGAELSIRDLG
jgi:hypothetical protein